MRGTTTGLSATLLAFVLAIGGCGGGDDNDSAGTPPGVSKGGAPPQTESSSDRASEADADSQGDRAEESSGESQGSESEGSSRSGSPARSEPREAKGVRTTLATFLAGMRERDARKVCSTYTRQTRTLVGSALATNCAGGMKYAFRLIVPEGSQDAFAKVRVRSVAASGNRATARLQIPKELAAIPTLTFIAKKGRIGLRRESGEWRVELLSLL